MSHRVFNLRPLALMASECQRKAGNKAGNKAENVPLEPIEGM
jgi:hypothetical protein